MGFTDVDTTYFLRQFLKESRHMKLNGEFICEGLLLLIKDTINGYIGRPAILYLTAK
jgi:hypothetical protein